MHKDANLRKRNALVIPGGLLVVYSVVGILYAALVRAPSDSCPDSGALLWIGGTCRSAVLVLAIPLVLGLALVGVGALAFRSKASCRHGHGSWTHFTLALLVSLVLVPILAWVLSPSLIGPDAAITRGGVDYPLATILAGASALGFLMLLPFSILYLGQTRANPCCAEKGCFSPCFCDEPAEPAAPAGAIAEAPLASTPASWEVVPSPAPAPPPAPAPAPEPVPAPMPETPPPAPAKEPEAPSLTARPADPAAPPSDGMAEAAKWAEEDTEDKWAEEDKEALEELEESPSTPKKRSKPAKKAAPTKGKKSNSKR